MHTPQLFTAISLVHPYQITLSTNFRLGGLPDFREGQIEKYGQNRKNALFPRFYGGGGGGVN